LPGFILKGAGRGPPLVREMNSRTSPHLPPSLWLGLKGAGRGPPLVREMNSRTSPHLPPSLWLGF